MSMKGIKERVVADRGRRIRDGRKAVPETLNALGHCVRLFLSHCAMNIDSCDTI